MKAWHFLYEGGVTRDGITCQIGTVLSVDGDIIPCKRGLHGSVRAIDALQYAPGPVVCLVEMRGTVMPHGNPVDKHACSEREVIAMADATDVLRKFARDCALDVIHLWSPPDVAVQYLKTGDKSIRDAARDAAWAADRDADRDAAWAAANDRLTKALEELLGV
jgi:hypothetical protein